MKKRIISFILIFTLLLASCNKNTNINKTPEKESGTTTENQSTETSKKESESKENNKEQSQEKLDTKIVENTSARIKKENAILEDSNLGYVNNIIILLVKDGVNEEKILSWFPDEKAEIVGKFPKLGQYQIKIKPRDKKELKELANKLMEKEEVLFAHMDLAAVFESESDEIPQDYPENKKPDKEWWYNLVGFQKALEPLKKEKDVKVGVIDDGFDVNHEALNLEFVNDDEKEINSIEEHGTHVAGIVQQILPEAKITVTDSHITPDNKNFSEVSSLNEFLKYLVDMVQSNVKVINYSMGDNMSGEKRLQWSREYSGIISVYVWKLKQMGYDFVIVQSAGNSGIDAYYNGIFSTLDKDNILGDEKARKSLGVLENIEDAKKSVMDSIVLVASIDHKNQNGEYNLLPDSNYGDLVTVAAPGYGINSAVPGGYNYRSGTSQAAPVVTGTIGLLWSLDNSLTSGDLKKIIVESADTFAYDKNREGVGDRREKYPIINIEKSIEKVLNKSN